MKPMPPDHPRTVEALLSQSDWVRSLVRGLGVDESGTDDVLQSTWIAALTRPPRGAGEGASLRAWIARVARNFALRRIDRDARRAGRERASAKEERLPSAADVVEREEARAEVVRAVLDVQEPYRTALLLRFYEGLEPRDIARLQRVPDSTVRNRLKRGLALLRERLEATQGPAWRQRCLLVLPALRAAPVGIPKPLKPIAANAAPGGALVIKSLGIAALTAGFAGGVYFAWNRAGGAHEVHVAEARLANPSSSSSSASVGSGAAGAGVDRSHRALSAPQLVASAPASTREPVTSGAPQNAGDVAGEDDGHRCSLRGRILNPDGTPIRSDAHSSPRLVEDLTTGVESSEPQIHTVASGEESPVHLKFKVRDPDRENVLEKLDAMKQVSRRSAAEKLAVESAEAAREHEEAKIKVESSSGSTKPLDEVVSVLNEKLLRKERYEIMLATVSRSAHVLVASAAGDARELDVGSDGAFEFGDLRPGAWSLVATAPGRLARRMTFEIGASETAKTVDVTLEPSKELRVKLTTPDGAELLEAVRKDADLGDGFPPIPFAMRSAPGPRIPDLGGDPVHRFASASWRGREELDEATAGDASGVLELSDALSLHVGVSVRGVVLDEQTVAADAQEVVFTVPLEKIRAIASRLALRIVSAGEGQPIAGAWVDVAEFDGAKTGDDGSAELSSLAPGMRLLRYGADGRESRTEWVRIEPGKRTDLGVRELGPVSPIHGRVVDANGAPVRVIALLRDLDASTNGRELPVCDNSGTDAEGRFTFERAGKRHYVVTIEGHDWIAPVERIDARSGAPAEVLVHAGHSSHLKLTFPVEPPPGAGYVVDTADGIPVAIRSADGWRPLDVRLADGEYRARLVSEGRTLWTKHVVIQPGQMIAFDEREARR